MRTVVLILSATVWSCVGQPEPVTVDPGEAAGSGSGGTTGSADAVPSIPDVRCAGTPDAGPAAGFDHFTSSVISYGTPAHRGIDLVASASADPQTLEGDLAYSVTDKALEDEAVDVFACRQGAWHKLGTTRTDLDGHFTFALTGGARLAIGIRDLYVSVVGDRTGAAFLAFVAPVGSPLVVSDVDGTLTESENRFATSRVLGGDVGAQPDAGATYTADASAKHDTFVYLTARGNQYTELTRSWLAAHGFPRGPLRLSSSFLTLPGGDTIAFKTAALQQLATSFAVSAGVGNRASDVTSYTAAGVAAARIFIKLPEYQPEVQAALDAHQAIGFQSYAELATKL